MLVLDFMSSDGKLRKIYERKLKGETRLLEGAETMFFDPDGTMYFVNENADLITMTDFAEDKSTHQLSGFTTKIKDLGIGRPVTGSFSPDGTDLYLTDAVVGLLRVRNPKDPRSKCEVIATTVTDNGEETRIALADDIVVGPRTGKVYFSDGESKIWAEQRARVVTICMSSISQLLPFLTVASLLVGSIGDCPRAGERYVMGLYVCF